MPFPLLPTSVFLLSPSRILFWCSFLRVLKLLPVSPMYDLLHDQHGISYMTLHLSLFFILPWDVLIAGTVFVWSHRCAGVIFVHDSLNTLHEYGSVTIPLLSIQLLGFFLYLLFGTFFLDLSCSFLYCPLWVLAYF